MLRPSLISAWFGVAALLVTGCNTASSGGGVGGSAGTGGAGGSMAGNCTFTQTRSTSTKIPTVGIVTWSTNLSGVQSAHIDFGLTTSYGMTAPVAVDTQNHRTLLLGMKASKTYHYRIVASSSTVSSCTSSDYTIDTGALENGLPRITVSTKNASALFGGFILTGQSVTNAGTSGSPAYILDKDGDIVWWYSTGSDASCARMSYDGNYMWINSVSVGGGGLPDGGGFGGPYGAGDGGVPDGATFGPFGPGGIPDGSFFGPDGAMGFGDGSAHVHRVTMDGLTDDDFSSQFIGQNHQLTVLPDETIAFYAYGLNGCDDIKERAPNGTVRTIINAGTAHGGTGACHVNNIQYSKSDDTLVFSDLDNQDITKVTRSGSVVWVLNGTGDMFSGDSWQGGQHGIHLLGVDDLLIFNNNSRNSLGGASTGAVGTGDGSIAIEMKLNVAAKSAAKSWSYKANPGIQNDVMGDLQRMDNGNTVVGYSTAGVLHEVDANGTLLQELTWPIGASFGYLEKRPTLYGPPSR